MSRCLHFSVHHVFWHYDEYNQFLQQALTWQGQRAEVQTCGSVWRNLHPPHIPSPYKGVAGGKKSIIKTKMYMHQQKYKFIIKNLKDFLHLILSMWLQLYGWKCSCTLVSKLQYMLTTNGFSVKLRISRSVNTCSVWLRRIKFCLHIFFMANLCLDSLWRTR